MGEVTFENMPAFCMVLHSLCPDCEHNSRNATDHCPMANIQRDPYVTCLSFRLIDCVDRSESMWFFGPYGFVLDNVRPVPFIPVNGALGFFDWRKRLQEAI